MEYVEPIRDLKKIYAIKNYLRGKDKTLRDFCLFTLGINAGLRVSDLLELDISDVLNNKKKVKDKIIIKEKKTGKSKVFPISENAGKAIEQYLKNRDYELDEPLFISRKGKGRLQRQQAYRIINTAAKSVGVKDKIGTHTLRKTLGYHAYKAGTDISVLQKLFNHSGPRITLNYIGITQDQIDDVYLKMNL